MFSMKVNQQDVDVGCFMFHFQQDPYPGGLRYELQITDADLISDFREYFATHMTEHLPANQTQYVFNAVTLTLSVKYPECKQHATIRYWANTIDRVVVGDNKVIIAGVCSPHIN